MMFASQKLIYLLAGLTAANAANLYVSHTGGNVTTLSLTSSDDETYTLETASSLKTCGGSPSWLTLDQASGTLYCTDETLPKGSLTALETSPEGILTEVVNVPSVGGGVHNVLYQENKIYIGSASISTFALPLEPSSKELQTFEFKLLGPPTDPERQDAPHPHQVLVDPTGEFLLSPDLGMDAIHVYAIDKASGELTACPNLNVTGGDGPRHGAFLSQSSQGGEGGCSGSQARAQASSQQLFITNELSNTVGVYNLTYPASSGCLSISDETALSPYPDNEPAPKESYVSEVQVYDNFYYVSNRGDASFGSNEDSIAAFSAQGSSFLGLASAHGSYPRTFVINKDGTLVAIGNQKTANIAIIERDPETGLLGELVAETTVGGQDEEVTSVVWAEE
ncbi:hypothetical protein FQN54_007841 [Arachnomyces sp. PD_36]|nr:hypothetical protein FQN54_007841 [Arachnomyces sp. PD_36]